MATNEVFTPGWSIPVVCSHPSAPNSGDPVRFGKMTGIAQVDEGAGGNISTETSVYFGPGVFDLSVDDNGGSGIAVGDALYYHDTGTGSPASSINNSSGSADAFFGFALEVVTANATTTIRVMHCLGMP